MIDENRPVIGDVAGSVLAPLSFGRFILDEAGFSLHKDGRPVSIEPRALKALLHLARNRQRAVSNTELAAVLWPDTAVSRTSLKEAINLARRAVDDAADAKKVIATLRGHGYRFVATLEELATPAVGVQESPEPDFVGRVRELDALKDISSAAANGVTQIVLLEGEAGIGKSTLVRRFGDVASAAGFAVLRGQSDADGAAPPYWIWIQVLRELLRRPEVVGVRRRVPQSLEIVRKLVQSQAFIEPMQVAAHDRRLWLFDDIAEVLRCLASACPVLIVLEDLQSASEDSFLLLRFLARHLGSVRVMLLVSCRRAKAGDDAITQTLVELRRVSNFHELPLQGLTHEEVACLVGTRRTAAWTRELRRRTGGNPLFLKEVLRVIPVRSDVHSARSNRVPDLLRKESTPPGVRDLVAQRVSRLPATSRAVLEAAAVVGERFGLSDVAFLVGRRLASIVADIEILQRHGLVRSLDHSSTQEFSHPIVREAALALVPARRARHLHDRAVKRLERDGSGENAELLPQLAYHSVASLPHGSVARAMRYARAAAVQATTRLAYEEAVTFYREGLSIAGQRSRSTLDERAELLVGLAESASRTSDPAAARVAAVQGFRLARRRRPDLCVRAACALGPALLPLYPGTVDEQRIELLEETLKFLPSKEAAQRIRVYSELAVALYWTADSQRCTAVAEKAVALARRLGQPSPLAHALYAHCLASWRPSAGPADLASIREAIRIADRCGEGELAMACAVRLGHAYAQTGDVIALDRLIHDLERRAQRLGQPQARLWPLVFRASTLTRRRQLSAAAAAIEQVRTLVADTWEPAASPYADLLQANLRLEQGTFEGMIEVVERLAAWLPDLSVDAPLPLILASAGELEKAQYAYRQQVAQRPWETSDHMGTIVSLNLLAACAARFEDEETSRRIFQTLECYAGEYSVVAGIAGLLAPVSHTLGELCGTYGDYDRAVHYLEAAWAECRRADLTSDGVRTQLAWGRVLARRKARGDRGRARALGREAQRHAELLDSPLLVVDAVAFNSTLTS